MTNSVKVKKYKPTGEKNIFEQIWSEREHKCVVCKVIINDPGPINFSHILSKGAYKKFRLNKDNIVIKCAACHHKYEFGDISGKEWDHIKELKSELKSNYYKK